MTTYKHTQIGYLMLVVLLAVLVLFAWMQIYSPRRTSFVLLWHKFCRYCHNGIDSVYSGIVYYALRVH